jgi:superkiller protein 3
VDTLVNGAVLLGIPDELAWTIFIEGMDSASIGQYHSFLSASVHTNSLATCLTEGYGFTSLRHFIKLFPSLPLTNLLKGYFTYIGAPLLREDGNDGEPPTIQPGEDAFDTVLVKILSVLCILEPYALRRMHSLHYPDPFLPLV